MLAATASPALAQYRMNAAEESGSPFRVSPPALPQTPATAPQPDQLHTQGRACEGCPRRSVGNALLDELLINVLYGSINLARGQVTARITPKSWWNNMRSGWEWDLDDFTVNQFGHPYQGNNYFNSGRANGLSFWESAALTAFGSGTWEYFGETNRASLNDFINTTMGGIALGETFHRVAWLIRDPQATGRSRTTRELAAFVVDPVTTLRRVASGDASRISERPTGMTPSSLTMSGATGVLWRGSNLEELEASTSPFLEINILYGDSILRTERPYDRFEARLDLGGGAGVSELGLRGDLFSSRSSPSGLRKSLMQGYQYTSNSLYRFGGQSVLAGVSIEQDLGSRFSWNASGTGGVTVLGAVDSLPPGEIIAPPDPDDSSPGQGVSTGPRNYDYGPGGGFGGRAALLFDGRTLVAVSYDAQHLYTLDGVLANHLLQRARATATAPLRGRLGLSVTLEYFDRQTFYRSPADPDAHFHFPQVRAALTWSAE